MFVMVDGIFPEESDLAPTHRRPRFPDPLTDIPRSNARDERVSLDRRAVDASRSAELGQMHARITDQAVSPLVVLRRRRPPRHFVKQRRFRPARVRGGATDSRPAPAALASAPSAREARTRTRTVGALAAGGRRARRPARGGSSRRRRSSRGRPVGGLARGACVFGRDLQIRARSTRARARTRAQRASPRRRRADPRRVSSRIAPRRSRGFVRGANRGIGPGDRGRSTADHRRLAVCRPTRFLRAPAAMRRFHN